MCATVCYCATQNSHILLHQTPMLVLLAAQEKSPYIFGAGSLADLLRAWPEENFLTAINSFK